MDQSRIGRFTSSNIYRLMGAPKPCATYIKEKRRESRLNIEINLDATSHALSWGKALEGYVYEVYLELGYELRSNQTDVHESGLFCGTADLTSEDTVADIKCPLTRNSFCDLVDIIESESVEVFKKEDPEYYWQLVSNSILTNKEYAELIVFMPYEGEVPAIVEYLDVIDDFELQKDIQWVIHTDLKRIPHLPNNGGYKNLHRFKFKVPCEDQNELMEKVNQALKS